MRRLGPWLLVLALAGTAGCHDDLPAARDHLIHGQFVPERVGAARELGRIGTPEAIRVLALSGLHDPAAKVRVASIEALAHLENRHLADLFEGLLSDPSVRVQEAAAAALGTQGTPKALSYLELAYARVDGPARDAVARALEGHAGAPSKAVADAARRRFDRLLAAVRGPTQPERIGAAEELGRSGRPEAVRTLLPLLADRSISLAAAAARGLGAAGDPRAVAPLTRVLAEDYPALQRAAADALGALGDPKAIPALETAALDGGQASALDAVAALRRLGRTAPARAGTALCAVAGQAAVAPVAGAAAQGALAVGHACDLGKTVARALAAGGAEAMPALAVVRVLGKAALTAKAAGALAKRVADPDPQVSAAAWRAAAAAEVTALAPAARAALAHLETVDTQGRQEWVAGPLPTQPGWGGATAGAANDDDGTDDDGTDDGARYDKRFSELMHKVAAYQAKLAARRRQQMGLPAADAGTLEKQALAGLADAAPLARVELVPDLPPHLDGLLAAVAVAAGRLQGAAALPALRPLLRHPVVAVRVAAVTAVGEVPGRAAEGLVAKALDPTGPPEVIEAAADALARRKAGLGALVKAASRAPAEALPAVARALGAFHGAEAEAALASLLEGPAASEAATALGTVGGRPAADALAHLVAQPDPAGQLAAIDALGRIAVHDKAIAAALAHALHSHRPEIRAAAARVMRGIGLDDPWLGALAGDYDRRVRVAVTPAPKGAHHG